MTPSPAVGVCWSCHGPADLGAPFCATCGAVQPPGDVDHFTRLGLKRSFEIDLKALDRAYFDLQRKLHPDRFRAKTPRERNISQSQAVSLNQAYEALRDPLLRARHLLSIAGQGDVGGEDRTVHDPALLMDAMEAREALADAADVAAVEVLAEEANGHRAETIAALGVAFAAGDMASATRLTLRLTYLVKFADEVRLRRVKLATAA